MSDGASPKSDRVWEGTLDHERLDAYRVAVEFDDLVVQIVRRSGRGHGWLCDQAYKPYLAKRSRAQRCNARPVIFN